jgi:hypothetical protein
LNVFGLLRVRLDLFPEIIDVAVERAFEDRTVVFECVQELRSREDVAGVARKNLD